MSPDFTWQCDFKPAYLQHYCLINYLIDQMYWVLITVFQSVCLVLESKDGKERLLLELYSRADPKEKNILYSLWYRCAWSVKHWGTMAKSVWAVRKGLEEDLSVRLGGTCTEIGTIPRRGARPLRKDGVQMQEYSTFKKKKRKIKNTSLKLKYILNM